ncbi:MAG: DUF4179 domain-containing protein [Clostridia bacterium]|nr:DUF4179 domain-containing protein [Clostridia bacterium]
MSNTDDIRKMYGKITAPQEAVEKCLEIEKRKTLKFPGKRVVAIAACLGILLAVAIPVAADKLAGGFGITQDYGEKIQSSYPHKTDTFYKEIDSSSLLVTEGSKLSDSHQGLEVRVDEAYFDGAFMYISFVGEYDKALDGIDRFCYEGYDNYISIDGEYVRADLSGYSFSLFNSGEGLGGVLGFIYPYDRENAEVKINIPGLKIRGIGENNEVIGEIDESFELSFAVKKSAPSTLVYNANASREEVSVLGVTSSKGGVCVEIFVPQEAVDSKAGIIASVENESGERAGFIMGKVEETEGGIIRRQYFAPIEGEALDVAVYDKNNMDAGKLAELRCMLNE